MADIVVHRPPRQPSPERAAASEGPPRLAPPPPMSTDRTSGWTYALFPVLGSAGLLVIALVNGNPLLLLAGAVFVMGSVGMGAAMWLQVRGRVRGQSGDARVRYFSHVADVRAQLLEAAVRQRERALWSHPDPAGLSALARSTRLWERRRHDPDFLVVRLGVGDVAAAAAPVLADADALQVPDPAAREAAERLVAAHARVSGCPVALPVGSGTTTLVGPPSQARALARALLCQLAVMHAPEDVRVAVCVPPGSGPEGRRAAAEWSWVKWLPHVHHPGSGPVASAGSTSAAPEDRNDPSTLMVAVGAADLLHLLGPELERRRSVLRRTRTPGTVAEAGPALVVLVEGWTGVPDPLEELPDLGVGLIRLVAAREQEPAATVRSVVLGAPGPHGPRTVEGRGTVRVLERAPAGSPPSPGACSAPGGVDRDGGAAQAVDVVADGLSVAEAEALARALAPLRLSPRSAEASLDQITGLPELLGVPDVAQLDAATAWAARPERDLLRVPLGVDAVGGAVHLDLKESALGGMGPHGLVVGATGSGKSELLRTLVTGLAITHSPADLALVLVDYKGGATFAGLSRLPHVAGLVTDLEDDPATIDRVAAALRGELRRREEVLRASGDLSSIREHRQRRLAGDDVPALPHLLVVVDEFSELLAQQPDMADVFVTIGRLGRSLGVHLLLATQRLEEGRLRGLDSHLSYRLGLRTFSAAESRTVIGSADAFELPPAPGSAYLKVDTTTYERLRVSTVSGPYLEPHRRRPAPADLTIRSFAAFADQAPSGAALRGRAPLPPLGLDLSDPSRRSVLDVAVARLAAAGGRGHAVWLPPLPSTVPLAAVVGPLRRDAARGLTASGPVGGLRAPVGVVDLPDRQRQDVWAVDLSSGGGHLGVVGAPQSGKTGLLRTLVTTLALTHTPAEVQVHCLDLAGGGLSGLDVLPHVGTVASRSDPDLVRRVVAHLGAVMEAREAAAGGRGDQGGVVSRRTRRDGGPDGDGSDADLLLVVDGWAGLRADFEDLEVTVTALASRGAAMGLHLLVATGRWFDLRPAVRDLLGTKLELRLGEPADSVLDRAAARVVPGDVPGRMLVAAESMVARAPAGGRAGTPTGTGGASAARLVQVAVPATAEELQAIGRRSGAAWTGVTARPVELLPASVDLGELDDVPSAGAGGTGVVVGLREQDLAPLHLDLLGGPDPHLLVLGDAGAGKSAVLRTVVRALTRRCSPEEVRVVVVDYRRSLLGDVDEAHLSQYCAAAPAATGTIAALAERLAARTPGPDVTTEQLRARSWWSGPRAVVVVDDHDLVAGPSGDPLGPLVELLPVAADVGLHLVVARSSGGAGAGMSQPLLRRLRELGSPGLLLSGSREEGAVLHGTRMRPLPKGRALHVSRAGSASLVQVAWTAPASR